MAKERKNEQLDEWINPAKESGVAQLNQFTSGLQRDYRAVKPSLSLEFSNGQVEGQITRLKQTKRLGYVWANLDLLKKRELYQPKIQAA